jgi:hypothetical protein
MTSFDESTEKVRSGQAENALASGAKPMPPGLTGSGSSRKLANMP